MIFVKFVPKDWIRQRELHGYIASSVYNNGANTGAVIVFSVNLLKVKMLINNGLRGWIQNKCIRRRESSFPFTVLLTRELTGVPRWLPMETGDAWSDFTQLTCASQLLLRQRCTLQRFIMVSQTLLSFFLRYIGVNIIILSGVMHAFSGNALI